MGEIRTVHMDVTHAGMCLQYKVPKDAFLRPTCNAKWKQIEREMWNDPNSGPRRTL